MKKNEIKKQDQAIQQTPKNITEVVQQKIAAMTAKQELIMPPTYSPENALKSAWLKLQEVEDRNHVKALEVCTKESIANSLLDMVVQGLSPAKNQCYFVVYGKELTLLRSYMGTVAAAKRFGGVKNVVANVIYEGDEFDYEIDPETGLKHILHHRQSFGNIDITKIAGAYAVVVMEADEPNYVEIMTIDQIRKSWNQGATKGSSPAHKNFTDEMAKKTVIGRACKMFINTSDDSAVLVDAFNNTSQNEYKKKDEYEPVEVIDVETQEVNRSMEDAVFGVPEAVEAPAEAPAEAEQVAMEVEDHDEADER